MSTDCVLPHQPEEPLHVDFGDGCWDRRDWKMVQSPRWNRANDWHQETDHIRNDGPERAPGQTYTSMILDREMRPPFHLTSTMSFDERMAPLIVVGEPPAALPDGRWAYRAHFELVLFDEGINLWDHRYETAPSWSLAAKWRFPVDSRRQYRLGMTVDAAGFSVHLDGRAIGDYSAQLASPLVVGITACEGVNRFYDFSVEPPPGR